MKNSDFIPLLHIFLHLVLINGVLCYITPDTYLQEFHILYYNISWLLIAFALKYYEIGRREGFLNNKRKVLKLYLIFGFAYFAPFGFKPELLHDLDYQIFTFCVLCLSLFIFRWLFFLVRSEYRIGGGNSANVIVLGKDNGLGSLLDVFKKPNLGYRYLGYFDDNNFPEKGYLGKITDCFNYMLSESIDEVYCLASQFTHHQIQDFIKFADNNLIKIKIVPDSKEIYTNSMTIERYGIVPILNIRKVPLDTDYARVVKRLFDILVAGLVVVLVLSWLVPILSILVKRESPGPLFFKQRRHGLKRKAFWCYKFRSMTVNKDADTKMAQKNDSRITKIGAYMRKTSIDELPQFINVLMGDMSVVGPRPHMEFHTKDYENSIDKYLVRHFVKPGITGLAQVKGYRGEIQKKEDIENRTKWDIFYVERWSLIMDIKIIAQTVKNMISGESMAY